MRRVVRLSWALATLLGVVGLHGQAVQRPHSDLSGNWSIDTYLSDHSEQIARAIEFDTGEFRVDKYIGSEPRRGAGVPAEGGRRKERPARPGRGPVVDRLSDEERKVLAELIRPVQFPPLTLKISQSDTSLTITGDRAPHEMRTDGRVEKHALEAGHVNRTARWAGPQLRVTYEVGHAGTYSYSIVPTMGQLLIRINFERVPEQPGPFDIKIVYNRSKES
jgi:hypothetical protein